MFIFVYLFSLCIGSFMNVLIYRLPIQEDFIFKPSHCPKCKHPLKVIDLIPLGSYLLLKGRCRFCHEKISIRYFLVEFISGIIGLFCFWYYGFGIQSLIVFMMYEILLAISIIDLQYQIIPDELNFALFILAVIHHFYYHLNPLKYVIMAIIIPCFIIILNKIKMSFGYGDIKLIFVMGYYLGFVYMMICFMISILIAGIYAMGLLISKKANRSSYMAFAPFLAIGFIISLNFGSYFWLALFG
ncbi:MAG: prepilin peptidase [Traorella sp.]